MPKRQTLTFVWSFNCAYKDSLKNLVLSFWIKYGKYKLCFTRKKMIKHIYIREQNSILMIASKTKCIIVKLSLLSLEVVWCFWDMRNGCLVLNLDNFLQLLAVASPHTWNFYPYFLYYYIINKKKNCGRSLNR